MLNRIIYTCPGCPSTAPVASALSARYSHRSVVMMGGLICSLGVVIGAFSRNVIDLYLTVGFLNGKWLDADVQTHDKNPKTYTQNMIFTGVLCCRFWLCINLDPHSDHAGFVL